MTTITANLTKMFANLEPWDCSNSVSNLGPRAAQLTWDNARTVAADRDEWLKSNVHDTCDAMRAWAKETGAWEAQEIAEWSVAECLALFVQNVASELRNELNADNSDLDLCVRTYATEMNEDSNVVGYYYMSEDGQAMVDFYVGG